MPPQNIVENVGRNPPRRQAGNFTRRVHFTAVTIRRSWSAA
jgi:hypothetical protein